MWLGRHKGWIQGVVVCHLVSNTPILVPLDLWKPRALKYIDIFLFFFIFFYFYFSWLATTFHDGQI